MSPDTKQKRYLVGVDVGSRSLGLAAVEVDENGKPVSILNALSLIHDAGLDPSAHKRALTRKHVSGVARRTRRMYRERRKRLAQLDTFLAQNGFPLEDLASTSDFAAWEARAKLATSKIATEDEFKKKLSLALRHIARHRGWRNPYSQVESLYSPTQSKSPGLESIHKDFEQLANIKIPSDATVAELVVQAGGKVKLRGEGGLLSERLHQKDLALEIHKIADAQELTEGFTHEIIRHVFKAKSPKGSAEKNIGKDSLDPSQKRAWRATRSFQEYRIATILSNLRISETPPQDSKTRPLNTKERQICFEFLNSYTKKEFPNWSDIADLIGVERRSIKGTTTITDDGERALSNAPINETNHCFANCQIREIKHFWKNSTASERDALTSAFSNAEYADEESPEAIAATTLLRSLPSETLEKIDSIRLPVGRAAYSEKTLEKITNFILSNEADVTEARSAIFKVSQNWRPTPPPIHQQTGNPAVDRVMKAVNRWLLLAEYRWGAPERINVETMRAGFKSEKITREIERDQELRAKRNRDNISEMVKTLNIEGKVRRAELIRFQALQRQNGQCAYCGNPIDFKTLELDHIVPRSGVGSTNARVNLLATCGRCNREKGNAPFAVWAQNTKVPNVSIESAIQRVHEWSMDPGLRGAAWKRFQSDVIGRLTQSCEDEELDSRSKESVSWMAIELYRRLEGHYKDRPLASSPKLSVFRGEVTASARRASGMENSIRLLGNKLGKNRLDRRHHAVDASVIALLTPTVAQVLTERNSLRSQQLLTRRPDPEFGNWKEFSGSSPESRVTFSRWKEQMQSLVPLLQTSIDRDEIPVTENIRLRLANGLVHEEKVRPLQLVKLSDAFSPEMINRSATPALWTALTRSVGHDWASGLPQDPNRCIWVNGETFNGNDEIELFPGKAACLKVRGGYVELGQAFHHARLYRVRSNSRISYCMMRVYSIDLKRHQNHDLFKVELPPESVSVRQTESKLQEALRNGTAEYITWFVLGDELHLEASRMATGQVATFIREFGDVCRWRIRGFESEKKLRLKPSYFSAEGLDEEVSASSSKIIDSPGWRPYVNKLFREGNVTIVRRDSHGRPRYSSRDGLPTTLRIGTDDVANTGF